jgi:hypothetical protein
MLRRSRTLTVYDVAARRDAYSASLGPGQPPSGLDVQRDGKVAVLRPTGQGRFPCEEAALSWLSSKEPIEHPIGRPACGDLMRLVGDRIYFVSRTGQRWTLRSTDLGGGTLQVVRFSRIRPAGFDVEGRRAVYAAPSCAGRFDIFVVPLARAPASAGPARCPVTVGSSVLAADPRRRVSVRLGCPRGCSGTVALKGGRRTLGRRDFGLRRSGRVRVRLSARAARLLARRGSVRVVIAVISYDRENHRHRSARGATLAR